MGTSGSTRYVPGGTLTPLYHEPINTFIKASCGHLQGYTFDLDGNLTLLLYLEAMQTLTSTRLIPFLALVNPGQGETEASEHTTPCIHSP